MCDAGGHCIMASTPLPVNGEPCGSLGECAGALRCSGGTCREVRSLRNATAGEACVNPFDATANVAPHTWCATGLFCDFDHGSRCAPNPMHGDACTGQAVCPEGYACQSSVCASVQSESAPCSDPSACVPMDICLASVCTPMQPLGGPCSTSEQCFSGRCGHASTCESAERYVCP